MAAGLPWSYKPFLHHVTKGRPIATRPVKLRVPRRLPQTLSVEEVALVLVACGRLRDRFLFALLAETGMRIGQALGLRHEDFVSRERRLVIVPRNDNQRRPGQVHQRGQRSGVGAPGAPLQRLHAHRVTASSTATTSSSTCGQPRSAARCATRR